MPQDTGTDKRSAKHKKQKQKMKFGGVSNYKSFAAQRK